MAPLDRKLLRDLWRLRGQVIAIAFIVASGVGVLIMSLSSHEALEETAAAYYERYRFAQVFAEVKRAPLSLEAAMAKLPGVQVVETRISQFAVVDIGGFAEPIIARLVSIPERGQPLLNRLALRSGRWIAPGRVDEIIVSEPFAEAHGLKPGDTLQAVLKGNKRTLTVVGTALSPEFVYTIGPGALMPDDLRFGVFWMGRDALEAAYDLEDAFNEVVLSLLRGSEPALVIDRLDRLLETYGGVGAYARKDQISHWFLANELEQLRSMSQILPTVFLAVAGFLTNMVLARLIAIERTEIGLLKAFGYSSAAVGWHYAKMVAAMAGLGILLGWAIGYLLGQITTELYADQFRFPFLLFRPGPSSFAIGAVVSLAAALIGAASAVGSATRLAPAEAMRPPAPPSFSKGALSDSRLGRFLDQPSRMIARQLLRWPLRSFLTAAGIAMAVAVLVSSLQWFDSIDEMAEVHFFQAQRQDVTVGLVDPKDDRVRRELAALPGVRSVEAQRIVTVNLRSGHRLHRGSLNGVSSDARLQPIYDSAGRALPVPAGGLVLAEKLAEKLDVAPGERVWVEVLEGRRPHVEVPVVALFDTYLGMPAYMELSALNRLLLEPDRVEFLDLLVDETQQGTLFAELKDLPEVSAVMLRRAAVDTFYETLARTLLIFVSFFAAFACMLAFGVAYNMARVALSERGRELATLRVLGFSRWEISYILLGEVTLTVLIGLPLGCLAGFALAWLITSSFETELYRLPLVIDADTYGLAVVVVLISTIVSGLLVRDRLDKLDLIAVLKTRE